MKTLVPFEPLWKIWFGGDVRDGKGLLPNNLFPPRDCIDEMRVFCGGFTLTVRPKDGTILADSSLADKGEPGKLLWFRTNQFQIASEDSNVNMSPDCLSYGFGIERNGVKMGYRIRPDGIAKWGSLN